MLLVEGRCHSAEVAVNLVSDFGLFEGDHIAGVVADHPREDWVGAQVVEAAARKLVQFEQQFLILDLSLEPRIEQVILFKLLGRVDDLEALVLVLVDDVKELEESFLCRQGHQVERLQLLVDGLDL